MCLMLLQKKEIKTFDSMKINVFYLKYEYIIFNYNDFRFYYPEFQYKMLQI